MTDPILSKLSMAKRCLLSSAALLAIAAPIALGLTGITGPALAATTNSAETKHYRNDEWKFELDIPKQWLVKPPDPGNSSEVIRFTSQDISSQVIVWRSLRSTQGTEAARHGVQRVLAKDGYSNFVSGEISVGSRRVLTLDFDRALPAEGVWSCRYYFFIDSTLAYILGFGTISRDAMLDTFDRAAKSFAFEKI